MWFRPLLRASPLLLLLAACGEGEAPHAQPEEDPAMVGALDDLLMVDPDLVGQNRASNAAILPDGDGSIPVEDSSPEAIAAARADALALVGGRGSMRQAPAPREAAGGLPSGARLTAAALAAATGSSRDCADALTYTAAWAAKMPETFPVYPRGATQEAAGTDSGRCALRVVNFTTPVPLDEVIDFYFTRADKAGYSARHEIAGGETTLGGSKGAAGFFVHAARRDDGMTVAHLVVSGG
jgi:hypothetical protein